ncbi:DCT-10 protein [Aphelenchoides avenae]|nr:DCT-10 protein [Aphelenchus avenae]
MLLGLPHLEPFTGEGSESFSHWLRRFNAEAHEKPWTDAEKLRKLKAFLRGGPREKWDEFTDIEKATFVAATDKLKSAYENSFSKDIAKLNLTRCHRAGESVKDFVERLRKLVKAATVGSSAHCFKERSLEEFLDRVDDEIGFHVKAIMPKNMEEAVCQAMRFEGLLEARKAKGSVEDQADEIAARVVAALSQSGQQDEPTRPLARRIQCHGCGEWGHIRRDCYNNGQGWYDESGYNDYQRCDNEYYVNDRHNGRYDSGYVNRYVDEEDLRYRDSRRYSTPHGTNARY